ncbi:MAG TPA: hypothetical protein VKZ50_09700 [bacterium]|nr:hypothetical protein [bacterium]
MATLAAQTLDRARALARVPVTARPPFAPERCAAKCGVLAIRRPALPGGIARIDRADPPPAGTRPRWILSVDGRVPPHTPQWNGAVATALARTLVPPTLSGAAAETLAEAVAAELLLPMRPFRAAAARTDLTMDGLRELAMRFSAPIRLTIHQWLRSGTWRGYALLWRVEHGTPVLRWRAASPADRFPKSASIGVRADALFAEESRLYETLRTGRPSHGVEEIRTGAARTWWFTRFGVVREGAGEPAGRAALALVVLDRGR